MSENTANVIRPGAIVRLNVEYHEAMAINMDTIDAMIESVCRSTDWWDKEENREEVKDLIISIQTYGGLVIDRTEGGLDLIQAENGNTCLLWDGELTLILPAAKAEDRPIDKGDIVTLNRNRGGDAKQWLLKNWFGSSSMGRKADVVLAALAENSAVVNVGVVDGEPLAVIKTKTDQYSIPSRFLWATNVNWLEYIESMKLMACEGSADTKTTPPEGCGL